MKRILFLVSAPIPRQRFPSRLQVAPSGQPAAANTRRTRSAFDVIEPRLRLGDRVQPTAGPCRAPTKVLVASSAEKLATGTGDLWDSGKVASDQSIQVALRGQAARVAAGVHIGRSGCGTSKAHRPPGASRRGGRWACSSPRGLARRNGSGCDDRRCRPKHRRSTARRWIWFPETSRQQERARSATLSSGAPIDAARGPAMKQRDAVLSPADNQFSGFINGARDRQGTDRRSSPWQGQSRPGPQAAPASRAKNVSRSDQSRSATRTPPASSRGWTVVFDSRRAAQSVVTDKSWQAGQDDRCRR